MVSYQIKIERVFEYLPNDEGILSEKETYIKDYCYETDNKVLDKNFVLYYSLDGYDYKVFICGNACNKVSDTDFRIVFSINSETYCIILNKDNDESFSAHLEYLDVNKNEFIRIDDIIQNFNEEK